MVLMRSQSFCSMMLSKAVNTSFSLPISASGPSKADKWVKFTTSENKTVTFS